MDSATLLYWLLKNGDEVKALAFNYGQRHSRELDCAIHLAELVGVELKVIDISAVKDLFGDSSQTSNTPVPEGHYAEENMKKTVVPNRNMIMLSIAAAWGLSLGFDRVAYGAHAGDHTIYPDCREPFINALKNSFAECDWKKIDLFAPFLFLSKGDIANIGKHLGVPYQLTWTCYKGEEKPCGVCGSCTERSEAMQQAGIVE